MDLKQSIFLDFFTFTSFLLPLKWDNFLNILKINSGCQKLRIATKKLYEDHERERERERERESHIK